jgi:hypothetical protein
MKVTYRQVGGFVPMFLGCDLDSDQLPAEEAARLAGLVESAGFWTLADVRMRGAADMPTIWIAVEDGERSHKVAWSMTCVPDAARPLAAFLRERSHNLLDGLRTGR